MAVWRWKFLSGPRLGRIVYTSGISPACSEDSAMLDHVGIHVHSYDRSKDFFRLALAPLGYELILEYSGWAGFGWADRPSLWITGGTSMAPAVHLAFRAEDRDAVRDFHRVAVEAGGKDNGAPGLRPEHHDHYYAAYVLDPDGNNVEVVCHVPEFE